MERTKGYVVGKRSTDGVTTWTIKVQDSRSPHHGKKLSVASSADGVALASGVDVDFIIGSHNGGSTVAIDVAPRGIKGQGERQMKRMKVGLIAGASALALLVVIAFVAAIFQGPIGQYLADRNMEKAVIAGYEKVRTIAFEQLVTDDDVVKTIKDDFAGMYAARKVLLERLVCVPAFGDRMDDRGKCWDALYYSHGGGTDNWGYQKAGIPSRLAPWIKDTRQLLLDQGREHLRDSQRLKAFYEKRKPAALKAYRNLPKEQRERMVKWLDGAKRAFEHFYDPDVQARYAEYIEAYDAWWTSERGTSNPEKERERMQRYRVMKEREDALYERSPNLYFTLMAGRRHAEGGKELVATWVALLRDAQASIK